MGGVDHRSKIKYYLRLVFDIADITVNKSFIILYYIMMSASVFPILEKVVGKTFQRIVARQLIVNHTSRKRDVANTSIAHNYKKAHLCYSR